METAILALFYALIHYLGLRVTFRWMMTKKGDLLKLISFVLTFYFWAVGSTSFGIALDKSFEFITTYDVGYVLFSILTIHFIISFLTNLQTNE